MVTWRDVGQRGVSWVPAASLALCVPAGTWMRHVNIDKAFKIELLQFTRADRRRHARHAHVDVKASGACMIMPSDVGCKPSSKVTRQLTINPSKTILLKLYATASKLLYT